jgi:multidrug efflux pump subunit AcrA (membrane-fusion protein)
MRVEAQPDVLITGYVERVSAVADSGNMWMQPDLKEYPATVIIDGEYQWLRPGMSAAVEIIVEQLEEVLYVPIYAVTYFGDSERAIYVAGAGGPERRIVETGSFSVDFIEILEGLSEGELVYLSVPDSMRTDENLMSTAL